MKTKVLAVLVQLDVLSTLKGHDKEAIVIKDDNPKKRKALADKIVALIKDGYSILLADGRRVRGYDAEANEWLVVSSDRRKAKRGIWNRLSAIGKSATAVAPAAGG